MRGLRSATTIAVAAVLGTCAYPAAPKPVASPLPDPTERGCAFIRSIAGPVAYRVEAAGVEGTVFFYDYPDDGYLHDAPCFGKDLFADTYMGAFRPIAQSGVWIERADLSPESINGKVLDAARNRTSLGEVIDVYLPPHRPHPLYRT